MKRSLYKCDTCGNEENLKPNQKGKFMYAVQCNRQRCEGTMYRVSKSMRVEVGKGKYGNSENGWERFGALEPADHTPMDFQYGKQGRNTDYLFDQNK